MFVYDNVITRDFAKELIKDMESLPVAEWESVLLQKQDEKDGNNAESIGNNSHSQKNVYFRPLFNEKLHGCLEKYLSPIVQKNATKNITYSFYMWKTGSFLTMHDDWGYSFSATLYLNEYWPHDWGGYLFYLTKDNEPNVICPEVGRLAILDEQERHLVTPVTDVAESDRLAIQIRGIKKEN